MRYIGPFFRMNSLSQKEICGQLFYFSKEAVKTLVLNSKCGFIYSSRNTKKTSSNKDISILSKFSPLLCLYKKATPEFVHGKISNGFDSSSFKRELIPYTNALMTLSLLELSDFYSAFNDNSLENEYCLGYRELSKEQLDFYYENLRNSEGIFVTKKNNINNSSKVMSLIDKNRKFIFSDQAFMMNAYYLYSTYADDPELESEFKSFSLQILQMFIDYKDALYNLSFDEGLKTLLAFNVFYEYSNREDVLPLITDLSEFLCDKFSEKDYFEESLDYCALLSINLMYSFEHTNILMFKEKYTEISDKLISLYDEDNGLIEKLNTKKELKYSSFDICFYFLSILLYSKKTNSEAEFKPMISSIYKKFILNSNIITSWPEAPNLDSSERYKNFSLLSKDMIDETFFRMPNLPSPESSGVSPSFLKEISYSIKKDEFSASRRTFDSGRNMLIFFLMIHTLKDEYYDEFNIKDKITKKSYTPLEIELSGNQNEEVKVNEKNK